MQLWKLAIIILIENIIITAQHNLSWKKNYQMLKSIHEKNIKIFKSKTFSNYVML